MALLPVVRAPEVVAPSIALGDTIASATLNPGGDIDEFTFGGTAGAIVTAYLNTPAGFPSNTAGLEVLEPGCAGVGSPGRLADCGERYGTGQCQPRPPRHDHPDPRLTRHCSSCRYHGRSTIRLIAAQSSA